MDVDALRSFDAETQSLFLRFDGDAIDFQVLVWDGEAVFRISRAGGRTDSLPLLIHAFQLDLPSYTTAELPLKDCDMLCRTAGASTLSRCATTTTILIFVCFSVNVAPLASPTSASTLNLALKLVLPPKSN